MLRMDYGRNGAIRLNKPVKIETIKKIALEKGLIFVYDESLSCYVARDKITNDCLMEYANVTVGLIISVNIWREEFNKLKSQFYR